MEGQQFKFYFTRILSDCIEALIYLYENNVKFELHEIDVIDREENKESWFFEVLEINESSLLPVLKSDEVLMKGKDEIIEWTKSSSGVNELTNADHSICEMVNKKGCINDLTCAMISGLLEDTPEDKQIIRWPFHQQDKKHKIINVLRNLVSENSTVDILMGNTTSILNEIETYLQGASRQTVLF